MKINGYDLNLTENELDDILNNKCRNVELISKDFETYVNLSDNDKKALEHLVNASEIINDIALEQDHPLNKSFKQALEISASENTHAKKALELFNSLNGVAGHNGVDKEPIQIFKKVELLKGKNFYPEDLSVKEFHQILFEMAGKNKYAEIQNILSHIRN